MPHQPRPVAAAVAQLLPDHVLQTHTKALRPPTHQTDPERWVPVVLMQRFLSSAGRIVFASGEPPFEEPPRAYGEGWVTLGPQQPYPMAMEYGETFVITQKLRDQLREIGRLGDDGLATNLPGVERWVEVVGRRLPRPGLTHRPHAKQAPSQRPQRFHPGQSIPQTQAGVG